MYYEGDGSNVLRFRGAQKERAFPVTCFQVISDLLTPTSALELRDKRFVGSSCHADPDLAVGLLDSRKTCF
jgi:hypothetical protein